MILDENLAELYRVINGNLNKAVSRNIKRFPDDFIFRLTGEEFKILLFQNGIARWGGRRQAPNAFTEQSMAMLSGVLSNDRAIFFRYLDELLEKLERPNTPRKRIGFKPNDF